VGRLRLPREEADLRAAPSGVAARPSATFDVGLYLLGSLADGHAAPGALIDGTWAPPAWRLGLRAAAAFTTLRSTTVSSGRATVGYSRATAALGPRYRLTGTKARAEFHAAVLGGWLSMESSNLTVNGSASDVQVGTEVGLRIGPAWDGVVPWLGVSGQFWPGHEHMIVTIDNVMEQRDVPRFDLRLTVGIGLGRFQ
jgi:hypothetical protein